MLATGEYQQRSRELGTHMLARLHNEAPESVEQVRGRGLWAGVQVKAEFAPVRPRCLRALEAGLIVKETHDTTLRLAPPLMIDEADLDAGIDIVLDVLG